MTGRELTEKMQKNLSQVRAIHEEIVQSVRSLIPVLKDHNLGNMAKSFEEKLFMLDALAGELQAEAMANQDAFIDMIRNMADGGRR